MLLVDDDSDCPLDLWMMGALSWQARRRVGIDFVEARVAVEKVEPVAIRYPDEGFHWISAEFTGSE